MNEKQLLAEMGNWYEQSGGDPSRCEFCDEPLDASSPFRRGLDGAGAHQDCIDIFVRVRSALAQKKGDDMQIT